ncbi:MAG: type IV pilin protein [Gammaproteobacteria bacterium]
MRAGGRWQGFSLIELLVVVLIVAIIMAIGVPGYRQYVQRANRVDATAALLRIAAAQERFYLQQGSYASDAQLGLAPPAGLGIPNSERGYYNLSIESPNLLIGFIAVATPAAGEGQEDDDNCQRFSVNEQGQREAEDGGGAATLDLCWR